LVASAKTGKALLPRCSAVWNSARSTVCRSLGHSLSAQKTLGALTRQLDQTYRVVVGYLPANSGARIEKVNGQDELIVTGLDKLDEPESLVKLRNEVNARLPRVDLPEVLNLHAYRERQRAPACASPLRDAIVSTCAGACFRHQ
jgi:hypothetical protein